LRRGHGGTPQPVPRPLDRRRGYTALGGRHFGGLPGASSPRSSSRHSPSARLRVASWMKSPPPLFPDAGTLSPGPWASRIACAAASRRRDEGVEVRWGAAGREMKKPAPRSVVRVRVFARHALIVQGRGQAACPSMKRAGSARFSTGSAPSGPRARGFPRAFPRSPRTLRFPPPLRPTDHHRTEGVPEARRAPSQGVPPSPPTPSAAAHPCAWRSPPAAPGPRGAPRTALCVEIRCAGSRRRR